MFWASRTYIDGTRDPHHDGAFSLMTELIAPGGRTFKRSRGPEELRHLFQPSFKTRYRGAPVLKNALDLVIYMQLIEKLRPRSVIEIGS